MVKVDVQVPKAVSDGLWPLVGSKRRMSGQELVTLNVGGKVFTTRSSTLKQFPGSRLMRMLDGRDKEFKMVGGQIFVDRDGVLFSFIIDFLRIQIILYFGERLYSMNSILWWIS